MSTRHPEGLPPGGPIAKYRDDTQDISPPGEVDAGKGEEYQRGRAYIRPAPDFGQSKASLRFGQFEFNANGKGAAALLVIGVVGSVVTLGVSAYLSLPIAVVITMGALPVVLASLLILIGMLRS